MAKLPAKVSESVKRLNPQVFDAGKAVPVSNRKEAVAPLSPLNGPRNPGQGSAPEKRADNGLPASFIIDVEPIAAPRMTRRDKWLKPRRPCVERYFAYRDALRAAVGDIPTVPDELHCVFRLPMPDSWSAWRKRHMNGKPHRSRPDRDNMDKAVCDALFLEDGGVWKGSQQKLWAYAGSVEIRMIWNTPLTVPVENPLI